MFDETDVSCKSQHSVYSRYVNGGNIFEDFVGFTDLHETNYRQSKRIRNS